MTRANKLLQRDALMAPFSSIALAVKLEAARSARLNSGVRRHHFMDGAIDMGAEVEPIINERPLTNAE